jgi:hypothetical protein
VAAQEEHAAFGHVQMSDAQFFRHSGSVGAGSSELQFLQTNRTMFRPRVHEYWYLELRLVLPGHLNALQFR